MARNVVPCCMVILGRLLGVRHSVTEGDVDEILVTLGDTRFMRVVTDAVRFPVAARNNREIEVIQDRGSYHQLRVVSCDGVLDFQENMFVSARSQRIVFTRVLFKVEHKRGVVLCHAVTLAFVTQEVIIKWESSVAAFAKLHLTAIHLGLEVRLVLPNSDGHQGILAVVEEVIVWR